MPVLGPSTITATGTGVSDLRTVVAQALSGRVGLRPVGGGEPVELVAEPIEEREIDSPAVGFGLALSGSPAGRQLYDIALRADDGSWRVVAPHAVYFRSQWSDFGLAHITDTHVARRIDRFREALVSAGMADGAERMINWNDRFRGFVRFANQLHAVGGWVLILIWPFTRLVHAWSVPVAYLRRPPIVYRSRAPLDVRRGAGGVSSSSVPTESGAHVQS